MNSSLRSKPINESLFLSLSPMTNDCNTNILNRVRVKNCLRANEIISLDSIHNNGRSAFPSYTQELCTYIDNHDSYITNMASGIYILTMSIQRIT